eukprot:2091800-Rhodomonas_salina.1
MGGRARTCAPLARRTSVACVRLFADTACQYQELVTKSMATNSTGSYNTRNSSLPTRVPD